MKTRILFVDDEPLTLQGLRRMLRGSRSDWDMSFAESGDQAISLLSEAPFDIIVSDMLMPGMNGAELLGEVRGRFPSTVRFVLSGHADRSLLIQAASCAHQFLAKPCRPETLKASLAKAAARIESIQGNEALRTVLTGLDRFPSIPHLHAELTERLTADDSNLDVIGKVVLRDPGCTALLLKLVNSAFFGLPRENANAFEALSLIGLDTFNALVHSMNVLSQFDQAIYIEHSFERLWKHSLDVAVGAKRIALAENATREIADAAFTAGLLHNSGRFLLTLARAKIDQIAGESPIESSVSGHGLTSVSHTEASAYLFGLWGLPDTVVSAVEWHDRPSQCASRSFSPLVAVHAANGLIHRQGKAAYGMANSELDSEYLRQLGLESRISIWSRAIDQL